MKIKCPRKPTLEELSHSPPVCWTRPPASNVVQSQIHLIRGCSPLHPFIRSDRLASCLSSRARSLPSILSTSPYQQPSSPHGETAEHGQNHGNVLHFEFLHTNLRRLLKSQQFILTQPIHQDEFCQWANADVHYSSTPLAIRLLCSVLESVHKKTKLGIRQ